jgi:hypothetical protein
MKLSEIKMAPRETLVCDLHRFFQIPALGEITDYLAGK